MPFDYPYNQPPDLRELLRTAFMPPDATVDEGGAAQLPYVPETLPTFTEAALDNPGRSGLAQRIGIGFAANPVPIPRPTGRAGEDFFAALLASAANSYGSNALRAEREAQGRDAFVSGTNKQANNLNSMLQRQQLQQQARRDLLNARAQNAANLQAQKDKAKADQQAKKGEIDAGNIKLRSALRPVPAGGQAILSPQAIDDAAILYGKTKFIQPRTSEVNRTLIQNRWAEMNGGQSDIATNAATYGSDSASLKAMQKQYDAYRSYESTVKKNSKVLLDAMGKIRDTNSPILNKPLRSIDASVLGSEDMAAYNAAIQTVIPEFARLLNNPNLTGQLTDSARHEIEGVIGKGYTLKQMVAAIKTLEQDAENRVQSSQGQIDEINSRIRKNPSRPDSLSSAATKRRFQYDPKTDTMTPVAP